MFFCLVLQHQSFFRCSSNRLDLKSPFTWLDMVVPFFNIGFILEAKYSSWSGGQDYDIFVSADLS